MSAGVIVGEIARIESRRRAVVIEHRPASPGGLVRVEQRVAYLGVCGDAVDYRPAAIGGIACKLRIGYRRDRRVEVEHPSAFISVVSGKQAVGYRHRHRVVVQHPSANRVDQCPVGVSAGNRHTVQHRPVGPEHNVERIIAEVANHTDIAAEHGDVRVRGPVGQFGFVYTLESAVDGDPFDKLEARCAVGRVSGLIRSVGDPYFALAGGLGGVQCLTETLERRTPGLAVPRAGSIVDIDVENVGSLLDSYDLKCGGFAVQQSIAGGNDEPDRNVGQAGRVVGGYREGRRNRRPVSTDRRPCNAADPHPAGGDLRRRKRRHAVRVERYRNQQSRVALAGGVWRYA